ncbi:MAG: glycosyltransferase [Deltaproteobacteria bacterium]|nr:glycosyltransferase [Deltaproteobacteria bacterium]
MSHSEHASRIAVIIPCLDEALTIGSVVADFRRELPDAQVVVIDNGSTDATASIAAAGGAVILHERRRGKGHAVRKAFRQIDADIYLLVDGDGTYPAGDAHKLIAPVVSDHADVAIGTRLEKASRSEVHWINRIGNRLFLSTVNFIFRAEVGDLLTGYRAMTRQFVRQSPIFSSGFELETELTILALDRGARTEEVPVRLISRPAGSRSKIRIVGDGFRILYVIFLLLRDYRPLTFFGGIGLAVGLLGLAPGLFVTWEFAKTHVVRIPTAVLATGLEMVSVSLILAGVILTTVARRFREIAFQVNGIQEDLRSLSSRPRAPSAGGHSRSDDDQDLAAHRGPGAEGHG